MSDADNDLAQIGLAAERLIPELSDRLARHGLGEIEVRSGDLRLRVAGQPQPDLPVDAPVAPAGERTIQPSLSDPAIEPSTRPVLSPAVGYFVFGDGLGPGIKVEQGDALGFVDVLGVRHDVRAPQSGTVRNLVTETGEAVEYGQTLVELDAVQR